MQYRFLQTGTNLIHDDLAHALLLCLDRLRGVDDVEPDLLRHRIVFVQNPALENAEALFHIAGQAQIHPGFVIFERVAAA